MDSLPCSLNEPIAGIMGDVIRHYPLRVQSGPLKEQRNSDTCRKDCQDWPGQAGFSRLWCGQA